MKWMYHTVILKVWPWELLNLGFISTACQSLSAQPRKAFHELSRPLFCTLKFENPRKTKGSLILLKCLCSFTSSSHAPPPCTVRGKGLAKLIGRLSHSLIVWNKAHLANATQSRSVVGRVGRSESSALRLHSGNRVSAFVRLGHLICPWTFSRNFLNLGRKMREEGRRRGEEGGGLCYYVWKWQLAFLPTVLVRAQ